MHTYRAKRPVGVIIFIFTIFPFEAVVSMVSYRATPASNSHLSALCLYCLSKSLCYARPISSNTLLGDSSSCKCKLNQSSWERRICLYTLIYATRICVKQRISLSSTLTCVPRFYYSNLLNKRLFFFHKQMPTNCSFRSRLLSTCDFSLVFPCT